MDMGTGKRERVHRASLASAPEGGVPTAPPTESHLVSAMAIVESVMPNVRHLGPKVQHTCAIHSCLEWCECIVRLRRRWESSPK